MTVRIIDLARRHRAGLSAVAVLAVLTLAIVAVHRLASEVQMRDIRHALAALTARQITLSILLTAASYLVLTLYDVLALKVIGRPMPYRVAALASFSSYAFSHNIGFSWLTGGSARLRIYGVAGLGAGDVARIVTLAGVSFWFGVVSVFGIGLLARPGILPLPGQFMGLTAQQAVGIAALFLVGMWLVLSAKHPGILRFHGLSLPLPPLRLAVLQILVAMVDLLLAAGALAMLLPAGVTIDFPLMVIAFTAAIIGALLTHVPGGIGVFEAMMLLALPRLSAVQFLPALLAYRLIYYILPLFLASIALLMHEGRRLRHPAALTLRGMGAVGEYIAPFLAAALAFLGGLVLLVSAALPGLPHRLAVLHKLVPLPLIEVSHFASSLIGTALILFAPALYRRLDGAFVLVRVLLMAGIAVSLAKGFDWEEAVGLVVILALLSWARPAFYRRTRLVAEPLSPGWLGAGAAAAMIAFAIGMFAYKHLAYHDSLWWTFTLHGNGSRFLRATLGLGVAAGAFFIWYGFAPARGDRGDVLDHGSMMRAFATAKRSDMWLATSDDKKFLVAPEGDAFLMYGSEGKSWIAMGDPVGPPERWPDLMWRLRELADRNQGRVLFYQLSPAAIPFAIDLGLTLMKYGEEAHVDLQRFSLDGPDMRKLRGAVRRAAREGLTFEVCPPEMAGPLMPELTAISDAWLASKHGREKRFSVGRFEPDYLRQMPLALVRQQSRIVAFGNIWKTTGPEELSVDLMRHLPDVPNGTMDFLFISLFEWGRQRHYHHFNLGLAPLSGLEDRRLAPVWAKLGRFLYRHGEDVYGFEGLRAYKSKFQPLWEPRYIAGPAGLPLLRALADLAHMISR